jgi:hypothetical protein
MLSVVACGAKAFQVVVSKRKLRVLVKVFGVVYVCRFTVPAFTLTLLALVIVTPENVFPLVLPASGLVEPATPLTAAGFEFHI